MMGLRLVTLLVITLSTICFANIATYQFSTIENEQRAYQLLKLIRCPECQNQNLMESNSERAIALILEVSKRVEAGEDDMAIINALKSRYGDFISYDPPVAFRTLFLWFVPLIILLVIALSGVYYYGYLGKKEAL